MTEMNFRVVPIASDIAQKTRATLVSPQYTSLPAFSAVANGYGPCRSCLRTFAEGSEHRIYLTYNPFDGISDLPQPGPIFIHTEKCEEYSAEGFPTSIRHLPMLFEGFGSDDRLVARIRAVENSIEKQIGQVFQDETVGFIHVRNAEAGCFIARVERT